jgi:hypothetical protein
MKLTLDQKMVLVLTILLLTALAILIAVLELPPI